MAFSNQANSGPKAKRSRKKKSRTEVSSSSESESDVEEKKSAAREAEQKKLKEEKKDKKAKKEKKKRSKDVAEASHAVETVEADEDITMADADDAPNGSGKEASAPSKANEDFTALYLRKVAIELADDLDEVRVAKDFTERSLPMLIHALKQGESIFSAEEKMRILGATA
ncbi:hypothetical protein GQ43DRAFT_465514 [Delitschia confertaspora ATCC 74209]|uniref:Ribosome assembly protein 3 n=1 Tax=Delitschia confertaspora ATCC 74209 TaxID=1513339 RepID=A0A9P4MW30_9PLEO|nr:hypothetical protein GQ43DRAFT_465514 [Delitschia confertaspora ATCC 74209]